MMLPDIKARWVEALRSGNYEQGKYWLRSDNKYCCLGVLCDLYIRDTNQDWVTHPDNDSLKVYKIGSREGRPDLLPDEVVKWAGMDSINPEVKQPNSKPVLLTCLNDQRELSFEQIANEIEAGEL